MVASITLLSVEQTKRSPFEDVRSMSAFTICMFIYFGKFHLVTKVDFEMRFSFFVFYVYVFDFENVYSAPSDKFNGVEPFNLKAIADNITEPSQVVLRARIIDVPTTFHQGCKNTSIAHV